jgi:hypothetical protein
MTGWIVFLLACVWTFPWPSRMCPSKDVVVDFAELPVMAMKVESLRRLARRAVETLHRSR